MQLASQIREPFFNSFCINTKTRNIGEEKNEGTETPETGKKVTTTKQRNGNNNSNKSKNITVMYVYAVRSHKTRAMCSLEYIIRTHSIHSTGEHYY